MREIRKSGSMSGKWKRSTMVPPRHFSTLLAFWGGSGACWHTLAHLGTFLGRDLAGRPFGERSQRNGETKKRRKRVGLIGLSELSKSLGAGRGVSI